jgi:hypothetical protein
MIRLRFLIALFFFISSINTSAQEVIYSSYEKFDLKNGDFAVVGKVGSKIYTYRGSADGFYLDAYNDSMEKVATVLLDFFPKKIYETRFINYINQIVVLYQAVETGKVVQYAALLDDNGRLLKGPIQLTSAKTGIFGANRDYFSSAVSDDKKQLIVYGIEEKGLTLQFSGIWLDDQLGNIQRGSASFKAENDLEHSEGFLDNNGNFFLPAFTPVGSHDYADQLWLLSVSRGNHRFFSKEFPLNSLYAGSTFMKLDYVNNRVYTAGFYSEKKSGNYEGVLFGYYDLADSSWHNRKNLEFDEKLRASTGERNKKRAFNEYKVKQMIIKKDGGFVLISEDYFVTTRSNNPAWGGYYSYYYGPFGAQTVREYNYNDVFVLSYDKDGNKEWDAFVRKDQYSQEDGGIFSSYALVNTGGSLGFLFNDFNTRTSRIQLATVDAKGTVDLRSLAAGKADDPDWLPGSAKQVGIREVVVPALRKRQISFAKIVF